MHGAYLRQMLEPLGIYSPDAPYSGGELDAQGLALDRVEALLDENLREADLTAAESWGLEKILGLLACRPAASTPKRVREALAALLRIGGDSFTLEAINDTISGCGVSAVVKELGTGSVSVSFPGTAGVPEGFEEMKKIIEDILPAHVGVEYDFWYLTWLELEANFPTWKSIEDMDLSWSELETCCEYL